MSDLDNPIFKKLHSLGVVNNDIKDQFEDSFRKRYAVINDNKVFVFMDRKYHYIGNVFRISSMAIAVNDFVDKVEQLTFYKKYKFQGIFKHFIIVIFRDLLVEPLKNFISDKLINASVNSTDIYFKINSNIHIWGQLGAVEILSSNDMKILINVTDLQDKRGELLNDVPEKIKKGQGDDTVHLPVIGQASIGFDRRIRQWLRRTV